MRKMYSFLSAALFIALSTSVHAQLYTYTNDLGGAPAAIATHAGATNLARVNGTELTDACPSGFNSSGWAKAASYANNRPSVEFTITPDAGYELNVTAVSADLRISPKGPLLWRFAYSTDGGASWTTNGVDIELASSVCEVSNTISWDIPDFMATGAVWVRIVGFDAYSSFNGKAVIRNVVLHGTVSEADADGDGYGVFTDCNDADPAINPGAAEVCNGIDENCNGEIDEGLALETWYADVDGDGYGDIAISATSCDGAPEGYVADNTDCDDADSSVNPGAAEVCNGVDDDCDGNIDEGVLLTFYADADGDGYGDAAMTAEGCDAPAGYVADNADCNDADATVNPGATEICGNGVDENCNGVIDDADVSSAFAVIGDMPACANAGTYFQSTAGGVGITYQWIRNGMAIAGATDAIYTPVTTGYYQLEVTNGICTAISETTYAIIKKIPDAEVFAPIGTDICVYGYAKVKCVSNPGTGATYQWYFNGEMIAGATANLYETTEAGDYYVVVTGPNGCANTSAAITLTADCRLGNMAGSLALYPNPANGNFTIMISGADFTGEAMVHITDIMGRVVYTHYDRIIDGEMHAAVSLDEELLSGVYLVVVTAGERIWNTRVLIAD